MPIQAETNNATVKIRIPIDHQNKAENPASSETCLASISVKLSLKSLLDFELSC